MFFADVPTDSNTSDIKRFFFTAEELSIELLFLINYLTGLNVSCVGQKKSEPRFYQSNKENIIAGLIAGS